MNTLFWNLIRQTMVVLCVTVALPTMVSYGQSATGPAESSLQTPWTNSRLRGTPTPPPKWKIQPAFPGTKFELPTSLQEIPGTGRLLVTQMDGRIFSLGLKTGSAAPQLAGNISETAGGPVSLFSAIVDPDLKQSPWIYTCLKHPGDGDHVRVSRFRCKASSESFQIDIQSEEVLLRYPAGPHSAGCLLFGKDGMLYISTGDGSGPNPPDGLTTGQDVSDLLGAILRIDVHQQSSDRPYAIPSDNPFINQPDARPEIFAYGLRNPWKFGIDQQTGDVFVADNGWETWEMIHHVHAGSNCGWPIMEGRAELRTDVKIGPTPITPPAWDHPHTEANSVIGGPVYRGSKLQALNGSFIYGDYITGTVWAVRKESDNTYSASTLLDTDQRIVAFTEGSHGELFMLDYDLTGQIYEILPNNAEDLSESFPRLLSQTGLFDDVKSLKPAPGVVPYNVTASRWMDGADAERWVAIPGSQSITLGNDTAVDSNFPDGTVFVKHLTIPAGELGKNQSPTSIKARSLETQVLHYEQGRWNPYVYRWNSDASDAELVPSGGSQQSVSWPGDQESGLAAQQRTWRSLAENECRLCHNSGPGFVLGFVPAQLHRAITGRPSEKTQLELLAESNTIRPSSQKTGSSLNLVNPHDLSASLNDRARSWLHANCSMCHHKGGNAIVSIFLKGDLPFEEMNTNKGTIIGTFGMNHAKVIAPGDPWRSILMYRISKLGYARMPYIGSQVVDSRGINLIAEWIESLSEARSSESSPPITSGSREETALRQLLALSAKAAPSDDSDQNAVKILLTSTEGSLVLQNLLHAGKLSKGVRATAIEHAATTGADIRGLFDHFVPEERRRKTLGQNFDPQLVLTPTGDPGRGQLIFFSDNARCRNCHHLNDPGLSVGPTLTEVSRRYPNSSEMLQQIVAPSQKIDEKFTSWITVTTDGRTIAGLLESSTETEIVLRTTDRKSVRIARAEIDELQKSPKSLMPDGVLADLTAQEAADLLAFIKASAVQNTSQPSGP